MLQHNIVYPTKAAFAALAMSPRVSNSKVGVTESTNPTEAPARFMYEDDIPRYCAGTWSCIKLCNGTGSMHYRM